MGTCVLAYTEPHPFPADERAVLTSLGGLIAQALERALLYDAKHQLAHGLQAALLPHSLPSLPGIEAAARYLPATQGMDIGGDFYDLVPAHGLAAAVIGDVQGHNVHGGRADGADPHGGTRVHDRRPGAGGGHAQHQPAADRPRRRAVRQLPVSAARPAARGRAVMARAGHPPPLLRRPDGRVRVLDLAGGPLLGIDGSAAYPTTEVDLAPGLRPRPLHRRADRVPRRRHRGRARRPGRRLAEAGDRPLDELADELVRRSAAARERIDDVALLLLRACD